MADAVGYPEANECVCLERVLFRGGHREISRDTSYLTLMIWEDEHAIGSEKGCH